MRGFSPARLRAVSLRPGDEDIDHLRSRWAAPRDQASELWELPMEMVHQSITWLALSLGDMVISHAHQLKTAEPLAGQKEALAVSTSDHGDDVGQQW